MKPNRELCRQHPWKGEEHMRGRLSVLSTLVAWIIITGCRSPESAPTPPAATDSPPSPTTTTAAVRQPNSITYSELGGQYTISGSGKYGDVLLFAETVIPQSLLVHGTVGSKYIDLLGTHSRVSSWTSLSGDCGDLGKASLHITTSDFLPTATMSGTVGTSSVSVTLRHIDSATPWARVAVDLIAILFDVPPSDVEATE